VQGEELNGFIEKRQCSISLWSKLYLLLNIVHGIRHLINYEIVHLDLKPMNIMVCRYLITKILDFGEAYSKEVCDNSNYISIQAIAQDIHFPMQLHKSYKDFIGRIKKLRINNHLNILKSKMFLRLELLWLKFCLTPKSSTSRMMHLNQYT